MTKCVNCHWESFAPRIYNDSFMLIRCYPYFPVFMAFFLFGNSIHAQYPNGDLPQCYAMEMDRYHRARHPERGSMEAWERWLKKQMSNPPIRSDTSSLFTIPVIVHVIHQQEVVGNGDNLSYEQIQSQFDVLQEDFRRIEDTPGFNPEGIDTEIAFCPALLTPQGVPLKEAGVNRVFAGAETWDSPPYRASYFSEVIQPATQWDPSRYLNIWVADFTFSGAAQFPDSSGLPLLDELLDIGLSDGIAVHYQEFGRIGNLRPNHNFGRVATHEIGHWLGLRHIWGDGDCEADDGCEDTPASDQPHQGCPFGVASCGSTDMIENYMDNSNGFCRNLFTACQKHRMRTVLARSPRRKELKFSPVCFIPDAAPSPAFSFSPANQDCQGTVIFQDRSLNLPFFWSWDFGNGQTSESPNPIVTFDAPGTYTITLRVENFLGVQEIQQEIEIQFDARVTANLLTENPLRKGDTARLTAQGVNQYLWSPTQSLDNPSSDSPKAYPTDTTVYTVTGTNLAGCISQDSVKVDVLGAVNNSIWLSSPTSSPFSVQIAQTDEFQFSASLLRPTHLRIRLFDLLHREVALIYHDWAQGPQFTHRWSPESSFSPGVYFIHWESELFSTVQKVRLY